MRYRPEPEERFLRDLIRVLLSVNMLKEYQAEPRVVQASHAARRVLTNSTSLMVCLVRSPRW